MTELKLTDGGTLKIEPGVGDQVPTVWINIEKSADGNDYHIFLRLNAQEGNQLLLDLMQALPVETD